MALELGNLLGAATNLTTALSKGKSLKSFLARINDFGVQVSNNFEVNIFGLEDITFFVQSVSFGGLFQKIETLHYDGRSVPFPTYIDYDHSGQMTVINDGNGYIYAAISNFIMGQPSAMLNNGVKMTIKCLTGDDKYKGSLITLNSVMLEKLDGLQFQYNGGDISTFNVGFQYLDFNFTPGALADAAGIIGAIDTLVS